jgi:hypothetical protein
MSRSLWRCRNPQCPVPHGAVLGRVTSGGGLVLSPQVKSFQAFLDSQRVTVVCPICGHAREFRGCALFSQRGADAPSGTESVMV